jgi:hypothetical protein
MKPTIIVVALLWASPAVACHHYLRWYYPYPQHCGGSYARHQERNHVHSVHSDPAPSPPIRSNHDVGINFVLPALVSAVWNIPLETKEQLELYEGIQRKKAILLLPHGD